MSSPMIPLGEIADFVNGVAFKADEWGCEGRPIIRIQNLNDPSKPFNRTSKIVADRHLAKRGDLLVSWAASLGVYEWQGDDACINQHIFKVLPRSDLVDRSYLRRALEASIDMMETKMHGATMKHITREKFLSIEIPVPPLPEQARIAAALDKADQLVIKRRDSISRFNKLLEAVFFDMFGDPIANTKKLPMVNFSDAIDFITGYPFKSADFLPAGGGIKLCRGTNVLPSELDWTEEANWPASEEEKFSRFKVSPGDVVIAMDRPWISSGLKIVLVDEDDPECLLVQRVARLRAVKHLGPTFLYCLFSSEAFKYHCKPTETTVPHISPNDFRSFPIFDPGASAAAEFEAIARSTTVQTRSLSESHTEAKTLFEALQHRAFSRKG